ncbi:hypothetical protein VNO77_25338 [Canavalia gladiata]|uniref:Uncharacterized protein n=1 Tax=Canavalia gladiata TaxID=3824 RepID=A0AAN9L8H4_CANGL
MRVCITQLKERWREFLKFLAIFCKSEQDLVSKFHRSYHICILAINFLLKRKCELLSWRQRHLPHESKYIRA